MEPSINDLQYFLAMAREASQTEDKKPGRRRRKKVYYKSKTKDQTKTSDNVTEQPNTLSNPPSNNQKAPKEPKEMASEKSSRDSSQDVAQDQLSSSLVPVKGDNFNLNKRIMAAVYPKSVDEKKFGIYHVWLDCLYNVNVCYNDIISELEPLFRPAISRAVLPPQHIFIVGHQFPIGLIKPAGSCFLVIRLNLLNGKQAFEEKILSRQYHMKAVDVATLRHQLKDKCSLLVRQGYKFFHSEIPVKAVDKACKKAFPDKVATKVENKAAQDSPGESAKVFQLNPIKLEPNGTHNSGDSENQQPPEPPQKLQDQSKQQLKQPSMTNKPAKSGKRKRLAACLNGFGCLSSASEVKLVPSSSANDGQVDTAGFEAKLRALTELDMPRIDKVSKFWQRLSEHGNAVLRIDHLPAKLTIHALNLMMGTFGITQSQVVAITIPNHRRADQPIMNVRIVLRSNSQDLKKILDRNSCRTAYDTILLIKRTDLAELEAFLRKHHAELRELEVEENFLVKNVPYSISQQTNHAIAT